MSTLMSLALALTAANATPEAAESVEEEPKWVGESTISAGSTTGNTRTTDVSVGLNLAYNGNIWRPSGEITNDFGKNNGVENKNRTYMAAQLDRVLDDPDWSLNLRTTYEVDQFSGFNSRFFSGIGVGYRAIDEKNTTWRIETSPGVRRDDLRQVLDSDGELLVEDETNTHFVLRGGSKFKHRLNEIVSFRNDSDIIYGDDSTQIINQTSLTTKIFENLSSRLSFDVRHDTNAPVGTTSTDTATRISLAYGFSR